MNHQASLLPNLKGQESARWIEEENPAPQGKPQKQDRDVCSNPELRIRTNNNTPDENIITLTPNLPRWTRASRSISQALTAMMRAKRLGSRKDQSVQGGTGIIVQTKIDGQFKLTQKPNNELITSYLHKPDDLSQMVIFVKPLSIFILFWVYFSLKNLDPQRSKCY